jgi:DNA-binding transcriptional LysR family regulator
MQFESLKIFCDIARQRSFSRAAEANGITQSAASQIVHQLEERLGVQLINRSTRPLQLTELGRVYYEGCQGLINQYLELEASVRQTQAELASAVRVAAIYSVGLGDMGQIIERFKVIQPDAHVHVEYLHPDRVVAQVVDRTVDFGLVSFPRKTRLLNVLPWREEEMLLACSPSHPLATLAAVRPDQLADVKFIAFDRNLQIRREVDRFLRDRGVGVQVVAEFDNVENIKKAVEDAAGVALLPGPALRREVQAGTLVAVPLADGRLVRPLGILHHRHHRLGMAAGRFLDLLRHPDGAPPNPPPVHRGRTVAARASRLKARTAPV